MENQLLFITALWLVDLKQEGDSELASGHFHEKGCCIFKSLWLIVFIRDAQQAVIRL